MIGGAFEIRSRTTKSPQVCSTSLQQAECTGASGQSVRLLALLRDASRQTPVPLWPLAVKLVDCQFVFPGNLGCTTGVCQVGRNSWPASLPLFFIFLLFIEWQGVTSAPASLVWELLIRGVSRSACHFCMRAGIGGGCVGDRFGLPETATGLAATAVSHPLTCFAGVHESLFLWAYEVVGTLTCPLSFGDEFPSFRSKSAWETGHKPVDRQSDVWISSKVWISEHK